MNEINLYNISLLKKILYKEIEDYYAKKEERKKISFDLEIINICIDLLEKKNVEELANNLILFQSFLPDIYEIEESKKKKFIDQFSNDIMSVYLYETDEEKYKEPNSNISRLAAVLNFLKEKEIKLTAEKISIKIPSYDTIKKYNNILYKFKLKKEIEKEDYDEINKLLNHMDISEKNKIYLLDAIRRYNIINKMSNNKNMDLNKMFDVPNILSAGFEELKLPTILASKKKWLDSSVNNLILVLETDLNSVELSLPSYTFEGRFSNGYSKEDFEYICTKILKKYQDEMFEFQTELSVLKNYKEYEYRKFLVDEFNLAKDKYTLIRNYMNKQLKLYEMDLVKEEKEVKNNIYFAKASNFEDSRTYFENDMKDITKDRYNEVKKLIDGFKYDNLGKNNYGNLFEAFPGLKEIRGDQIRIIYRNINENNFVILGVFTKKSNNDLLEYNKYSKRSYHNLNSEEEIQTKLDEIFSKSQNGGRNK
ncbi:MAG: hypothetical protein MR296_04025 [Tenericutes bacterium]|nr:hypothetical protein [Mycoplasmatota bacterium]